MAYLPQDENLDERLRQAAQQGQGETLSGQSGIITQSPMSGNASTNVVQRAGGNQFANIGQYLTQNDASGLAEKASSKIEEAGTTAKNAIKGLEDEYKNRVEQNTVRFNQDLINKAISNPVNLTDAEKQQIKSMRTASYKGPQNISDIEDKYTDAMSKFDTAKLLSSFTTSEEGRAQLARDVTTGRRATGGVVGLNNLLLSSDPNARARLKQATDNNADLDQRLESVRSTAAELAQNAKKATQDASLKTTKTLLDTIQSIDADLANRTALERSRLAQQDKMMRDSLDSLATNGSIENPENLAGLLGISQDEARNLLDTASRAKSYNINFDPNSYIVQLANEGDVNKKSVATADEYARLQALADLAGTAPILEGYGSAPSRYSGIRYTDMVNQLNDLINARIREMNRPPAPEPERTPSDLERAGEFIQRNVEAPVMVVQGVGQGLVDLGQNVGREVTNFARRIFGW
jgi:hypothetical protein